MAEIKTRKTTASVKEFLDEKTEGERRRYCQAVLKLMKEVTKDQPKMWGPSIVGFGSFQLVYANGKAADWPVAAFSPRKTDLTLYLTPEFESKAALLAKLGTHKTGKSCLYLKRLSDVNMTVLKQLVTDSVRAVKATHAVTA